MLLLQLLLLLIELVRLLLPQLPLLFSVWLHMQVTNMGWLCGWLRGWRACSP